jgi:uncharacterized membrane protein YeaQ/YmgE (transglycosylase-associated protein family)
MEIIGVIAAGVVIGLLGTFVAPGNRDNTPIWLTILCGIGGVLIGAYIYTAFGANGSPGIDWVPWIIAIVVAAVLLTDRVQRDWSVPTSIPVVRSAQ